MTNVERCMNGTCSISLGNPSSMSDPSFSSSQIPSLPFPSSCVHTSRTNSRCPIPTGSTLIIRKSERPSHLRPHRAGRKGVLKQHRENEQRVRTQTAFPCFRPHPLHPKYPTCHACHSRSLLIPPNHPKDPCQSRSLLIPPNHPKDPCHSRSLLAVLAPY